MSKDPSSVELRVSALEAELYEANKRINQSGDKVVALAARVEEARRVAEELDLLASELRAYEHEGIDLPWLQLERLAERLR